MVIIGLSIKGKVNMCLWLCGMYEEHSLNPAVIYIFTNCTDS